MILLEKKSKHWRGGQWFESQAMGILDCFGISKSDFNAQQLSHSNASDAVVDEKIDGYIISGSLGQSHQMSNGQRKMQAGGFGKRRRNTECNQQAPLLHEYTIPSGTYPNQESDVKQWQQGLY